MAKMYYNLEEAVAKLGCTEEELKGLVREGRLREFRDAGKLNYRVEEVDKVAASLAAGEPAPEAGDEPGLGGSGEIPLTPLDEDEGSQPAPFDSGAVPQLGNSDSDVPIDLSTASGSAPGVLSLEGDSGELKLEDSGGGAGGLGLEDSGGGAADVQLGDSPPPAAFNLEDSGGEAVSLADSGSGTGPGADIVSLDEVDKDAIEGMKKDDTVITNIGISVFDDDDLEIAADPMAKTLMTGGDDHLGLDGSGGGSGLLDLTRESDDTSLGAELLEGIDMGDTAETAVEPAAPESAEPLEAGAEAMPEPELEPVVAPVPLQMVAAAETASPVFTGLLIAGTLVLALLGAANVATSLNAWPAYLATLSEVSYPFLLAGGVGVGLVFAMIGWLVQLSGSRAPRRPKPKLKAKGKKGAKGVLDAAG